MKHFPARLGPDPTPCLVMRPLVRAQDATLDAFIAEEGSPSDVVAKGFVRRTAVMKLLSQRPICDELVEGWIDTFRQRMTEPRDPASAVLQTLFYRCLTVCGYDYPRVKGWTRSQGDVFALDRLFVPLFVPLGSEDSHRVAFVMIDMNAQSLTYYDAYLGVGREAITILLNLRQWLCDEHMDKRGVPVDLSSWVLELQPSDIPKLSRPIDDGVFVIKAVECLSRGEPLSFTDELMPRLRRPIALEVLTGRLCCDEIRRRARANVLVLLFVAKVAVLAIRARERAWEPGSVHVVALEAAFRDRQRCCDGL